ncbi:MAG: DUF58 domain-containing protein [Candidatus Hydrogenedentota bacterium]|nr:MAG: DUF58 domain-containing protein [Candidatus Hydrogenedentota bacterium]
MASSSHKTQHPRFLKTISGETLIFFALLLSIGLAGFNSGNNLLYLIASVMLGTVFVSLVAGRVNLSRIEARRRVPNYVFAGHPFRVGLEIFNNKRLFDSFGIGLEGAANGRRPFLVTIRSNSKEVRELEVLLKRRGLHKLTPMTLTSAFPLGLFELRKKAADKQEIIVYPHIYDLSRAFDGPGNIREEFPRHLKGPGSGLYGVREYRHGEDAANISWKLSAKLDKLIVRETECEEKRRVCIAFDNVLKDDSAAALEAFEQAVSAAASLVWYLYRSGYSVKLVTRGKSIGYGQGFEQMHRMLIALALIEPAINLDEEEFLTGKGTFEGAIGVLVSCAEGMATIRSTSGDFAWTISERIRTKEA